VIDWFTTAQIVVAVIVGVVCVILGLAGRTPNDYTLGALLLVELLLIAQIVIAAVAPAFGNGPTGDPLEFWIYLVSAAILPPAAVFWALVERNRWSTAILGVAALAIAVMVYRMSQIWFVQGA
jgi:membrane-bound ClpP family serine protease